MSGAQIRVWDPLVRIFHWALVASIAIAWITGEDYGPVHEWAGYVALGLVGFRLIWGIAGPKYARFSQFVRGPRAVIAYAKDMLAGREKRYLGHNPLGGAMVIALLLTTAAAGISGWLIADGGQMAGLREGSAPMARILADDDDDDEWEREGEGEEALEEIHEFFANLLLLLIALHVAGVIYASWRHRENLPRAMITGKKPAPGPDDVT